MQALKLRARDGWLWISGGWQMFRKQPFSFMALLFGVVALMPGLGCMIAAGITWLLAQRLGLMPGAARNAR